MWGAGRCAVLSLLKTLCGNVCYAKYYLAYTKTFMNRCIQRMAMIHRSKIRSDACNSSRIRSMIALLLHTTLKIAQLSGSCKSSIVHAWAQLFNFIQLSKLNVNLPTLSRYRIKDRPLVIHQHQSESAAKKRTRERAGLQEHHVHSHSSNTSDTWCKSSQKTIRTLDTPRQFIHLCKTRSSLDNARDLA